jgi:hypothetical protein
VPFANFSECREQQLALVAPVGFDGAAHSVLPLRLGRLRAEPATLGVRFDEETAASPHCRVRIAQHVANLAEHQPCFQEALLAKQHGFERRTRCRRVSTGQLQPCDREGQMAVGVIGLRGAQPLQGTIEVAALDHVVSDRQPCRRAVAVLGEQAAEQDLCMQHLAARCMFLGARPSWIARPSCLPVGRVHSVRLPSCMSARSSSHGSRASCHPPD